jgi:hypothetical protein
LRVFACFIMKLYVHPIEELDNHLTSTIFLNKMTYWVSKTVIKWYGGVGCYQNESFGI